MTKKSFARTLAGIAAGMLVSVSAFASSGADLLQSGTDLGDRQSLQRGAALYMNYCSGLPFAQVPALFAHRPRTWA